jgi:hypothetical protein
MIPQVSASTPVSAPVSQPTATPLSQLSLQFGKSTLTLSSISKKTLIIVVILALSAFLFLVWRKIVSAPVPSLQNPPVPREMEEWVKHHCADLKAMQQEEVARIIMDIKQRMEASPASTAKEIFEHLHSDSRDTPGDTVAQTHVLKYFETAPSLVAPTPPYKLSEDEEIQAWLVSRDRAISKDLLGQVISKIHEIENHSTFVKDPKTYILALRLEVAPNPIQSKAVAYLTIKHKAMARPKAK